MKAVQVEYPDFGTEVYLVTDVGKFSQRDHIGESELIPKSIQPNKTIHAWWADKLSNIMYWPILFIAGFPIGLITFGGLMVVFIIVMRKKSGGKLE